MKKSYKVLVAILVLVIVGGIAYYFSGGNNIQGLLRTPGRTNSQPLPTGTKVIFTTSISKKDITPLANGKIRYAIALTIDGTKLNPSLYTKYEATLTEEGSSTPLSTMTFGQNILPSGLMTGGTAFLLPVAPNTKTEYNLSVYALKSNGEKNLESWSTDHLISVDPNHNPAVWE